LQDDVTHDEDPASCSDVRDDEDRSGGTVTNSDSRGRVISRETTTGNTTTVYDAGGRSVRFTRVALLPWR
jgi:YD repeat-containing protein